MIAPAAPITGLQARQDAGNQGMRLFDKDTHGLGLVNPHTEPGTRSAADTRPLGLTGAMARRTEVQAARAADDKHIAVRNFADPLFLVRGRKREDAA